jgi:Mg-chelatase subunit ChlD
MQAFVKKALCVLLVQSLAGCQLGLASNAIVWPTPSPQVRPPPFQPNQQRRVTRPNFEAPSATHCQRPIETRELSDSQAQPHPWPRPVPYGEDVPTLPKGHGSLSPLSGGLVDLKHDDTAPSAPAPAIAAPDNRSFAASDAPIGSHKDASPRESGLLIDDEIAVGIRPPYPAPPHQKQPPAQRQAVVTAGMVDDNAAFTEYLAYRQRTQGQVAYRERDVRERYLLEVNDAQGRAVPDAEVAVQAANGATTWLRTDAGGKGWIHPNAFDPWHSGFYEVTVRQGGNQATAVLQRGQRSSLEVRLGGTRQTARAQLDLVFLVDATGSMGDEIDKLKRSLRSITDEVSRLPSHPDLCLGLVAYRDKGDAFFVRSHDLTNDVNAFQGVLNALQAAGGGDEPEAMNEALHETVHHISWRGDQTTRLVVLVADAPPHLDYGGPQYDDDMLAALGKGIKLMSVGASGLNQQGEYIQRQIAQYTGGRFIFLTYADASNPASGPGRDTVHDVRNYSVQSLDQLVVRLVREELEKLPKT